MPRSEKLQFDDETVDRAIQRGCQKAYDKLSQEKKQEYAAFAIDMKIEISRQLHLVRYRE